MFFLDPAGCLRDLQKAIHENTWKSNAAEMALIYSGIALASFTLCRMEESVEAYSTAFELTKQVGDDARMSVLASNLCVLQAVIQVGVHVSPAPLKDCVSTIPSA